MEILLYADEIKRRRNVQDQAWMYIGLSAIPADSWDKVSEILASDRQPEPADRYVGYEGEIHFSRLTQRRKADLAKRWLSRVMWDHDKCFHFHILGISLDNLIPAAFGIRGSDQQRRIYNRFFRASVAYILKSCFAGHERIHVARIFHDRTEMETDDLFDWHTIWRLEHDDSEIDFADTQIEFIDSDHALESAYPEHSHFIQLTDLILGAAAQCLDYTSRRQYQVEVANHFLPLIQRLTDSRQMNPNSRYRYHRRCTVSFFPQRRLTLDQLNDHWEKVSSGFFTRRSLYMIEEQSGQCSLF